MRDLYTERKYFAFILLDVNKFYNYIELKNKKNSVKYSSVLS